MIPDSVTLVLAALCVLALVYLSGKKKDNG